MPKKIDYDSQKTHYIVATAIIIKDGKYLITQRAKHEKVWPNMWTVPGGKLNMDDYTKRKKDAGEALWYNVVEDLAHREVMEEAGIKIKNLGYVTSCAYIRPDGIPTLIISLYADWKSGKVKLCDDMQDFAWVTTKEAKKYKLIEGIWDELYMLDKILKGRTVKWRKRK